jgi:hypothetical protein
MYVSMSKFNIIAYVNQLFTSFKLTYLSNFSSVLTVFHYVKSSPHTKFLGLIIDDSLSWKAHIDQMMSKLSTVCFLIWK